MKYLPYWGGLRFVIGWSMAILVSYLIFHFLLISIFETNVESLDYKRNITIMLLGISLFFMVTPTLILNKILCSLKSAQKFGDLQLRLPVLFKDGNQQKPFSKQYLIREFFMSILLIPTAYCIFRLFEFISYDIIQKLTFDIVKLRYQDNSLLLLMSIMSALYYCISLSIRLNSFCEIRELGVVTDLSQIRWEKIFDYQWLVNHQGYVEIFGRKHKLPQGLISLKIKYLTSSDSIFFDHNEYYIFAHEQSRDVIEKIFTSKLIELNSFDILHIPPSSWDKIMYRAIGSKLTSTISQKGIFRGNSAIPWQNIADCQWRDLKNCDSLMGRFLQLNNRKKYCILRVQHAEKRRSNWIEIPVPGSLVTQAHELLVKYLPDHVQINQPPSSC